MFAAAKRSAGLCGKNPRGYRSPAWDLSPATAELLIRHGFLYESSMMGNDHHPYQVRTGDVISPDEPMRFGEETDLIEMPISWSLDDFPHFEFFRTPGLMATLRRARELGRRFRIHDAQRGVGRPHLHLPSLRDRPRPSHDDAGAADPRAARARRVVRDDGGGGEGVLGEAGRRSSQSSSCPGLSRPSTSSRNERRRCSGHRRAEATPFFGQLRPAMTKLCVRRPSPRPPPAPRTRSDNSRAPSETPSSSRCRSSRSGPCAGRRRARRVAR